MDKKKEKGRAGGAAATTQLFSGFFLALSPDLVYFHKDGKAWHPPAQGWECVGGFAQGEGPFGEGDLTLGK